MAFKSKIVQLTVVTIVCTATMGILAPAVEGADLADVSVVRMKLDLARSAAYFVRVVPSRVKLWRDTADRPSLLRVETLNASPHSEIYWEIRFDPSAPGATEDYFGDIDVPCGVDELDVGVDKMPDAANAVWPFKATAYVCVDGAKGAEKASLGEGLRVIWKD